MKRIELILNIFLWLVWIGISAILIIQSTINKPPEYEFFKDKKIQYIYTDKNGKKEKSTYHLSWNHPQYAIFHISLWPKKSSLVFYDPIYKNAAKIKDEFLPSYLADIPKSKIEWWKHWIPSLCILGIIILGILIYTIGNFLKDLILYYCACRINKFPAYAFFLLKKRSIGNNKIMEKLKKSADSYILSLKDKLYNKYPDDLANLLIHIIYFIKYNGNTNIPFYFSFLNDVVSQEEYLKRLYNYWNNNAYKLEEELIKNPQNYNVKNLLNKSLKNREYVAGMRNEKYEPIKIDDIEENTAVSVASMMSTFFNMLYGDKILSFNAYRMNAWIAQKSPTDVLLVKVHVYNSLNNFYFASIPGNYAGLEFEMSIGYYYNNTEKIMWKEKLPPKCTYSYNRNENGIGTSKPDVQALYRTMIRETIHSFPDVAKKI